MTKDKDREESPAIDVPEADVVEQTREPDEIPRSIPIDVPEADALEQARDAELNDEEHQP